MSDALTPETQMALIQATQPGTQSAAQKLRQAGATKNMRQIEAAAKDFEAVFLASMMKPMFEGVKPNAVFGGGKGEEIFQGIMLQEYGKIMAEAGGIGLAEQVKAELIRIQEEGNQK